MCRMNTKITLIVYHGGMLQRYKNGVLEYVGGEMDVWEELDSDTLNLFDLVAIVKSCRGHDNIEQFFWRVPNRDLNVGLRQLTTDSSFMEMVNAALSNGNEIELYYENPIMELEPIMSLPPIEEEENVGGEQNVGVEQHVGGEQNVGEE